MALSTVSGVLKRNGMGKLGRIGLEPAVRYERDRPGELIHIDVKKLGRIQGGAGKRVRGAAARHYNPHRTDADGVRRRPSAGSTCTSRSTTHSPRLRRSAPRRESHHRSRLPAPRGRLLRPPRHHGRALLTDNGSAYRSVMHALACRPLGIRHLRTRPYRPQTNGKAERFIRTLLNGWAYGAIYRSSNERTQALDGWLWHYNHQRRHSALGHQTPIARLNERQSQSRPACWVHRQHLVDPAARVETPKAPALRTARGSCTGRCVPASRGSREAACALCSSVVPMRGLARDHRAALLLPRVKATLGRAKPPAG